MMKFGGGRFEECKNCVYILCTKFLVQNFMYNFLCTNLCVQIFVSKF